MLELSSRGLVLASLLTVSTAASATTLLSKTSSPGFVMSEYALQTTCTLDDQGIVTIKTQINGLSAKKTMPGQFDIASIHKKITESVSGKIKKPEMVIADLPSTVYNAYQKQTNGNIATVFLYEDNGMQEQNSYNESPSALSLRTFLDAICK
jgi:hypothetical protein